MNNNYYYNATATTGYHEFNRDSLCCLLVWAHWYICSWFLSWNSKTKKIKRKRTLWPLLACTCHNCKHTKQNRPWHKFQDKQKPNLLSGFPGVGLKNASWKYIIIEGKWILFDRLNILPQKTFLVFESLVKFTVDQHNHFS